MLSKIVFRLGFAILKPLADYTFLIFCQTLENVLKKMFCLTLFSHVTTRITTILTKNILIRKRYKRTSLSKVVTIDPFKMT